MVEAMLPVLVAAAQWIHRGEPEVIVRTAVLAAWSGLAGCEGWTPAMVRRVERVMGN